MLQLGLNYLPGILGLVELLPDGLPGSLQAFVGGLRPVAIEAPVGADLCHEGAIVWILVPALHVAQDVDVPCPLKAKLPSHCVLEFPPDLRSQAHGLVPPGNASNYTALVQLEADASLRNLE